MKYFILWWDFYFWRLIKALNMIKEFLNSFFFTNIYHTIYFKTLHKFISPNQKPLKAVIIEESKELHFTEGCVSPSFETIYLSGANGTVVHYTVDRLFCNILEKDNILLVDSGGCYLDFGTVDVTKYVFLGDTWKIPAFHQNLNSYTHEENILFL